MSTTSFTVKSLSDLSLENVPRYMNEDSLKNLLESCPPSIIFHVLWKNLRVNRDSEYFFSDCALTDKKTFLAVSGRLLATFWDDFCDDTYYEDFLRTSLRIETQERFVQRVQISFEDTCKFYKHFNLNLFFKLVKVTECRTKLYIIFQMCVRKRGLDFPKLLANEWLKSKKQIEDNTSDFNDIIKRGLELGIFLSDTGWFVESSIVLSYTYKIISNKWECLDQTLRLTKASQCLTKWLLAVLSYYDLEEATVVLNYLLNTINNFERVENPLCMAYLYLAVSQYYYTIMDLDKAWLWVEKSINNLRYEYHSLTPMVISQAIKICGIQNKISKGLKLLHLLYTNNKEINQNIIVDILMNETNYFLRAHLKVEANINYHIALDTTQSIFGYYNLRTAKILFDYAQTICNFEYELKAIDAMPAIFQAVTIMTRIGLPEDNMLIVQAKQIAAHILPIHIYKAINIYDVFINPKEDQIIAHCNAINAALRTVGDMSLITANAYCNLGRLYSNQAEYRQAESMYLHGIKIKEFILGKDHPKVAFCLDLLTHLYTYKLKQFEKARELCVRSVEIYNISNDLYRVRLIRNRRNVERLVTMCKYERFRKEIHEHEAMEMKMYIPELLIFKVRGEFDLITTEGDFSLGKIKLLIKD